MGGGCKKERLATCVYFREGGGFLFIYITFSFPKKKL